MLYIFQQLLNALQLGSIYALIALGYTMVYGVLTMINFAHGDVFMVGAFLFMLAATVGGLSLVPALLCAMVGAALLGLAVERVAYRPLREAPRVSAVITALGCGLFMQNLVLNLSPYPRAVPQLVPNGSWSLGGLEISVLQVSIILVSALLMVGLDTVVRKTKLGLAMRAISQDARHAVLMGVPINRVISSTFAIGAGLGGLAGAMYAMAYPVIDAGMGTLVGWKAFVCAVIGGIGSLRGAVLGGFLLAAVEVAVVSVFASTYRDFSAFALLLVLLLIRPYGILGQPLRQKL
ncbi:MAG: branched-chain amino acid ABC transporter permease [Candidatus Methylacidiphilales bacterium]